MDRLADDAADKVEVEQVVLVVVRQLQIAVVRRHFRLSGREGTHLVRLVGERVGGLWLEEGVSGVEDLPREHREPLPVDANESATSDTARDGELRVSAPRDTAGVNALLVVELDIELAVLDLVARLAPEYEVRVFEDAVTADVEVDRRVVLTLTLRTVMQALRTTPQVSSPLPLQTVESTHREEEGPLVLKVEHGRVAHENGERTAHE